MPSVTPILQDDRWRSTHLGRLMGEALRRFDERVLHLMAPLLTASMQQQQRQLS